MPSGGYAGRARRVSRRAAARCAQLEEDSMLRKILVLSAVSLICGATSVAFADENGAITGGVAGAVGGAAVGGPVGAIVGGVGGAAIGNSMTNHRHYYHHGYAYYHPYRHHYYYDR